MNPHPVTMNPHPVTMNPHPVTMNPHPVTMNPHHGRHLPRLSCHRRPEDDHAFIKFKRKPSEPRLAWTERHGMAAGDRFSPAAQRGD
jgi:hypothetical protein